MATHALPASHILDDDDASAAPRASSRPSFIRRVYVAILISQMRRAQREIDRKLGPGSLQRAMRNELPRER